MLHYYVIYKPYLVLSQFTTIAAAPGETKKQTLKDYFAGPLDVYPVGRLDYDSEGLLLLTNDTKLNYRLLNPIFEHEREYWVQVEGIMDARAMATLRAGVMISIDGKPFMSAPCRAESFDEAPLVPPRDPPIRVRRNIPDSWIRLALHEGKNRQVRKMTAKVGHPTLRLIRNRIEGIRLDGLEAGQVRELKREEVYQSLFENRRGTF